MLMTAVGQTETDVAEIFSLGRFTVRARRFDLRPGTAMDLRAEPDLNKETERLRGRECRTNEMPLLLVGSPTMRSVLTVAELTDGFRTMEGVGA